MGVASLAHSQRPLRFAPADAPTTTSPAAHEGHNGNTTSERRRQPLRSVLDPKKGRDLAGLSGITTEDRKDIEQELTIQVWRSQQHYDPSRSSENTFTARVVDNKVASILKARRAGKRDAAPPPINPDGLEREDETGVVIDLGDLMAVERRRQRRDELRIDVSKVMKQLSPDQCALCRQLMDGSVADVANDTDTPRTSMYGPIAELRRHFERAGLHRYVRPDGFSQPSVSTRRAGCSRSC